MRMKLSKNWPDNIDVSNFQECSSALRIGDLFGNQFTIALRIFNQHALTEADLQHSKIRVIRTKLFEQYWLA